MMERTVTADQLARLLGSWQHSRPGYVALANTVRTLVLDGRLPPGTRLPSERELARALQASRTTVAAAYGRLRELGFLISRRGSASRVAVPQDVDPNRPRGLSPTDPEDGRFDLGCASLAAPPGIGAAVEAAAAQLPAYLGGHGYTQLGLPALRELLAQRYTERGLPTTADQILVVGGALQAFALVLQAFVGPGDRVLVEHPTYANALETIGMVSGRPVPVALGPSGWDLDMLEATLRQVAPRVAYLIADFQNPTGRLMSAADRARVADLMARTRTLAVVDETLVALGLDVPDDEMPAPLPAYGRAESDLVLIGSASKAYWGGLGIGWVRAPISLMPTLLAARVAGDLGTAVLSQLTVAELLASHSAVIAAQRAVLLERRAVLMSALRTHLPDWRFDVPAGGMALWCELPRPAASALAAACDLHGVRIGPGPKFGVGGAFERFVRMPYTLPEAELVEAVRRVASAYSSLDSGRVPAAARTERFAVV
jgi:DNA-binding transcriptional MocR family regulator